MDGERPNVFLGHLVRLRGVEPEDAETFHGWNNTASLALHRRLGFVQEGRLRRMTYTNGQYHDEILLGMPAEELDAQNGPAADE